MLTLEIGNEVIVIEFEMEKFTPLHQFFSFLSDKDSNFTVKIILHLIFPSQTCNFGSWK
jgi:hypothetical protein